MHNICVVDMAAVPWEPDVLMAATGTKGECFPAATAGVLWNGVPAAEPAPWPPTSVTMGGGFFGDTFISESGTLVPAAVTPF